MKCFLLAAVFLAGAPLSAQPRTKTVENEANELAARGKELFDRERYKEAAVFFRKAVDLTPTPTLLWNLARAHDQSNEWQSALDAYRQLINLGSPEELVRKSKVNVARISGAMAQAEREQRAKDAEMARVQEEKRRAESNTESVRRAAALAQKRHEEELARAKEAAEGLSPAQKRRVASFVVGGVALAAWATAGTFGGLAASSKANFHSAQTLADKQVFQGQAQSRAVVADVMLGVGLATGITAMTLFFWPEASTAASLSISPQGATLAVGGHF